MGAYLSEPVTDKFSSDETSECVSYGASSMQGWRVNQEDAHNSIIKFDDKTSLFAVYDGHGGPEVAQYCARYLPEHIKSTAAYKDGNLSKALEDAYLEFDAKIITDDALKELKRLSGLPTSHKDEEEENEIDDLCNEATMPLEEVLAKYQGSGGLVVPSLKKLCTETRPKSPFIRAKSEKKTGLDSGECSSSSNSSSAYSSGSATENDENSKEEAKEDGCDSKKLLNGGSGNGDSNPVVNSTSSDSTPKKMNSFGDSKDKEEASGETVSKADVKVEDGEVSKKGKGKALLPPGKRSHRMYNAARASALDGSGGSDDSDTSDEDIEFTIAHSSDEDDDEPDDEDDDGEEDSDDDEEEDDDDEEEEMDEESDSEWNLSGQEEPGKDSGCTAVVALLRGCELYVANAGDSRCVVSRQGRAVDMSVDHKPEDAVESTRIEKAGGKVTADGRVNGGLNLSRAIGDHFYKTNEKLGAQEQMITALPDLKTLTLTPEDEFMIIACDGIWNSMTSQEVVDYVKERIAASQKISTICEALFDTCLAPNTIGDGTGCDNMTCVIVKFQPKLYEDCQSGRKRAHEDESEEAPSEGTNNCTKKSKIEEDGVAVASEEAK